MEDRFPIWLYNFLAACDITQYLDLARGIMAHGRLHRFQWGGAAGVDVEYLLRERAIHVYGRAVWLREAGRGEAGQRRRELVRACWVNAKQARWAEYILLRAGVALEGRPVDARNWRHWGRGAPRASWTGGRAVRRTWIEALIDFWEGR